METTVEKEAEGIGACCPQPVRIERIRCWADEAGFREPDYAELRIAREKAARLISPAIAPTAEYAAAAFVTGVCPFVCGPVGAPNGLAALLLLNDKGESSLREGSFDSHAPNRDHLAVIGTRPAAAYAWGLAATSVEAGVRVLIAARRLRRRALMDLNCYARAATADGKAAIVNVFHSTLVEGGPQDLYWSPGNPSKSAR